MWFKDQLRLGELYKVDIEEHDTAYCYTNKELLEAGIIIKEDLTVHSKNLGSRLTLYHRSDDTYFRCTLYHGNIKNDLFLLGIVNTTYELYKKSEHIEEFLHALHFVADDVEHILTRTQEHPDLERIVQDVQYAFVQVIKSLKA